MKSFLSSLTAFEIILVLSVLFVGTASFGLGRLSALQDERGKENGGGGMEIKNMKMLEDSLSALSDVPSASIHDTFGKVSLEGPIKASKNGTKYYFSNCPGASRIAKKNTVIFQTPEEAEKAGYSLASGCGQ